MKSIGTSSSHSDHLASMIHTLLSLMNSKQLISRTITDFYNNSSEETRLDEGMGVFEYERVKCLIEKHLPKAESTILDVGGGTGKYSEWLACNGHIVHMIEPIEKHIKQAQIRNSRSKKKFTIHCGESQNLEFPDNFADLVILHGPLYHLQDKRDREATIREARRVVKQGGIILGFGINYTASTLTGLLNGFFHRQPYFEMCMSELSNGIHNPPSEYPWMLAEAYCHRPEELRAEFTHQDLTYLNLYAVEGMAWLDQGYFVSMTDESKKKRLLELINVTENEIGLLPFSPHMMIAVQKKITT